ncbi:MAG TPA: amino acid adenylation domain-containing protein, partial [Clostridia bacterium]
DMLIADASSMQIIIDELMHYYNRSDDDLPELDYNFKDYIFDYKQLKKSSVYAGDKNYWLGKADGFPQAPVLPLKMNPSEIGQAHNKRMSFLLDNEMWNKLKGIAQTKNITIPALLCTAYAEVLAYWSNQPDMAINLTVFNRYPFHEDVSKIVGDFTSILLLDIRLRSGADFFENARAIQETLFDALEHRHYDGVEFIREISRRNNMGYKAIMPVVFTCSLQGEKKSSFEMLGTMENSLTQTSQVYLDNQIIETMEGASISWDYIVELFDEKIISAMFEQYVNVILSLTSENIKECSLKLCDYDKRIIGKYNSTEEEFTLNTLHGLFAEQAGRTPDNAAVIFEDDCLTYRELDEKSNQIAHYLKEIGLCQNELVGVLAKRCTSTIANIMGILKAGGAYVPVDPEYPEERKNYILKNSNCRIFMEPGMYEMESMSRLPAEFDEEGNINDIAYVIYTSGSTGKPKGVVITHEAAANTIIDINRKFGVSDKDRIIGLSSMCFDLSVYDIFGALATGAALVMIPDQRDVENLLEVIKKEKITVWNSVPAIMDMVMDSTGCTNLTGSDLRLVLLSGDWIPLNLPDKIKSCIPNAEVISLGGATEGSIWSIYYPVSDIEEGWRSIPYGYPLANQKFYVLNYKKEICPIDVQGELYIGGMGVAKGYLNDAEKTARAFIHHPSLGYLYRTGDYGVLHKKGYIEFLGRKDHQIKIRGYRIEMGEIESCLLKHNEIKNAVIIDIEDNNGKKSLCAYIVSNQKLAVSELKEFLSTELPEYMIPANFVQVEKIPLSSNGKVDRNALPRPEIRVDSAYRYVAPRNETEKKVTEIWNELLGIDAVGVHDAFFDIGGDSLKAVKLTERINKEFEAGLRVQDLFRYTTVSSIANVLSKESEEAKCEIAKFVL